MEPDGPLMRSAESLMLSISNEHSCPQAFQQNVTAPVHFPLSASSVHSLAAGREQMGQMIHANFYANYFSVFVPEWKLSGRKLFPSSVRWPFKIRFLGLPAYFLIHIILAKRALLEENNTHYIRMKRKFASQFVPTDISNFPSNQHLVIVIQLLTITINSVMRGIAANCGNIAMGMTI